MRFGIHSLGNVIYDHGIESDVRVYDDRSPDEGIEDGGAGSCYEGRDDEGDECDGEGAFKGPVVGAVGFMGLGNRDGVVDGTSNGF